MKVKDLAVKTGTYQKSDGTEGTNWLTVGGLFQNDKGQYILLDKTFNPAGVPGDKSSIMISLFDPKKKDNSSAPF